MASVALYYSDHNEVPLPPNHRFPMSKYARVRRAVEAELGAQSELDIVRTSATDSVEDAQLLARDALRRSSSSSSSSSSSNSTSSSSPFPTSPSSSPSSSSVHHPPTLPHPKPRSTSSRVLIAPAGQLQRSDASLAHDPAYYDRFVNGALTAQEMRVVGFPWSPALVRRTLASSLGTAQAVGAALECGFGAQLAGGTHHAFRDRGEGFCTFNDIGVATAVARARLGVERVFVADLDVHQGNGTARMFAGDEAVFTYSVHCTQNLYSARERSTLDVDVPMHTGDEAYLELVWSTLVPALVRFQPHLVLFQAGVDPLGGDRLGKLRLTRGGLQQRNRLVYDAVRSVGAPLVVCMGGGYSEPIERSIEAHADVYLQLVEAAVGKPLFDHWFRHGFSS